MIKFVKISKKDVLFDRKNASDILNKACSRLKPMVMTGAFETGERIVAVLEPDTRAKLRNYAIVPVVDGSEDGLIGEVNSRYGAGFSFCFSFRIEDSVWGIFCS